MKATPGKKTQNVDARRRRVVKVILCHLAHFVDKE